MRWKFWEKPKNNKVFVATQYMDIRYYNNEASFTLHKDLKDWLLEYKGKYTLHYDEFTGKRWIEFTDNSTAIQCRLIFA